MKVQLDKSKYSTVGMSSCLVLVQWMKGRPTARTLNPCLFNAMYCDLRGQIKENAEAVHHILQCDSREHAITDSYCTLPLTACDMNHLLHASER